jgi:5-methylcytosine-specific restriction endonuclease McrA
MAYTSDNNQDYANEFYRNKLWRRLSKDILKEDKHECQMCKAKGIYTRAVLVHHVNYLKLHPELALERHYKDDDGNIKRNLISICFACHEEMHKWVQKEKKEPLTVERW